MWKLVCMISEVHNAKQRLQLRFWLYRRLEELVEK